MTSVDQIISTIDEADGPVVRPASKVEYCCRNGCRRTAVADHDFCPPCLAWLRFEVDDDPNGLCVEAPQGATEDGGLRALRHAGVGAVV